MPWKETHVMDERRRFVGSCYRRLLSLSELCRRFDVSRNGGIRWNRRSVCVSHSLMEQHVGFEAIDEGLWKVYFGPICLGWFVEAKHRIVDRNDRELRRP